MTSSHTSGLRRILPRTQYSASTFDGGAAAVEGGFAKLVNSDEDQQGES